MIKLTIIVVISVLIAALIPIQPASAHVLVTDETRTKGAILHIIPDDDPIAGERATLYFDTQDQLSAPGNSVKLSIRSALGDEKLVETKLDGTLVTADFTFPTQGVYDITFIVTIDGKSYDFVQSQRVSRGATASALDEPTDAWAEIMLLSSTIGGALLVIVAFNRRRDIAKQSSF